MTRSPATRQTDMLSLIVLLALAAVASADPKRIELGFPQLGERVQVVFPGNYDPSRSWPAVFYYPGTNGSPDTRLVRHHTGDRDWFVIGMDYVQKGKFTMTKETVADELQIVRSVRQHLAGKYKLDPRRCYLAGFSKGGWLSGILLQADRSFAGAAILGAGHLHQMTSKPDRFAKGTSVFIGIGRKDDNYPFALRAVTWYRGLGATTTLETWPDLGHAFPQSGSSALTQWLALLANPRGGHQADAEAWLEERLEEIAAIRDPVDRWVALREAEDAPYADHLSAKSRGLLRLKRTNLEKTAAVSLEAGILEAHRKLLIAETKEPDRATYEKLSAAYYKLHQDHPGTRQGEVARWDHERVQELLKHFEEQEKVRREAEEPFGKEPAINPFDPEKAPNPRPRIPGNPLIR